MLANPIQIRSNAITIPVAMNINSTGGTKALLSRDQARGRALVARAQAKAKGESLASVPVPVDDAVVSMFACSSRPIRLIFFPFSKFTLRQLVLEREHTHLSWILGVQTPGLVPRKPTSLVQTRKTQEVQWQYSMGVEVSQVKNVGIFTLCSWPRQCV